MYRWDIVRAVTAQRVFGIIRSSTPHEAEKSARLILDAGLDAVEIAMTTPRATEALARLTEARPSAFVGAGTVLDDAAARAAVEVGACFLVSPNLDPNVVRSGHRCGVPVFPGVTTPTEIVRALEEGADAVKLFPASGIQPAWLGDVRSALPQAPIIPTGGITIDNAPAWISAGAVACGLGSALTTGDTDTVRQRVTTLLRRLSES